MLYRLPLLKPSWAWRCLKSGDPAGLPENEFLYGYARCALQDAYQLIGLKPGDVILYPDYVCDVILMPCRKLGLHVKYYPVQEDFQPEWDVVENLIQENAKAVVTINYFGFPQLMDQWKSLIEKYDLWWIEDNAHGFSGNYREINLGNWGHVSVSSIRKFMPMISGALLIINSLRLMNSEKIPPMTTIKLRLRLCREELRRVLGYFFILNHIPYNKFRSVPKAKSSSFYQDWTRPREIDVISRRLFPFFMSKSKEYSAQRRMIYLSWEKFCLKHDLKPGFPFLPDGISPLVFPCYAKSLENQLFWLEWGRKNSVDVHAWPNLPIEVVQAGGRAVAMQNRILCFPINQDMEIGQISELSVDHP